jgi:hypothetical protein
MSVLAIVVIFAVDQIAKEIVATAAEVLAVHVNVTKEALLPVKMMNIELEIMTI